MTRSSLINSYHLCDHYHFKHCFTFLFVVSTLSVCSHEQPIAMCVGVFCTCELNVVSDARFYNNVMII